MSKTSKSLHQDGLTHVNEQGEVHIVDIGDKVESQRMAIAGSKITMNKQTYEILQKGLAKKGDVLATARLAGIMAAKKCSDLIPLCHPLSLNKVEIDFEFDDKTHSVFTTALVKCFGRTGVEMEALTAVSITCLTIYDMLKAVDKAMIISNTQLLEKSGGRSGAFKAEKL